MPTGAAPPPSPGLGGHLAGVGAGTLQTAVEVPALTEPMMLVFAVVAAALVLFVWEPIPIDVTAVGGAHPLVVLGVFYLLTAGLTNVVSNNASVVLMIPVAVDVAEATGLSAMAFAFAVTFAASTAFMTPVGYQTNLMVYGPGGYRFTDYVRVGAPLQLLLAVVTVLGIAGLYGLQP